MKLIMETDIGRDPDDFFALCYLASAGVDIKAITLSPGDSDQVALTRGLLQELGLQIPIGAQGSLIGQRFLSAAHADWLARYGYPATAREDGTGVAVIADAIRQNPDCEFFCCGPLHNVAAFLEQGGEIERATMQGGFIGYNSHDVRVPRLAKFEGQTEMFSYNLNGSASGTQRFLGPQVNARRFVSKNVCHTITYHRDIHAFVKMSKPPNRAMELFHEMMDTYLAVQKAKVFHDPTAAVCHLHPNIGAWVKARLYVKGDNWGAVLDPEGDDILVDIQQDQLWNHIRNGS